MPIPESTLSRWSHHQAGMAFKQAHVLIRKVMGEHKGLSQFTYEVFLQGSYKNDTNLGGDSDVDVVIRLAHKLNPNVVALTGAKLQRADAHKAALRQWQLFRRHALRAMRARFGDEASSGRKTLKIRKGKLQADADLVVTLRYRGGIAFYLSDERRWVVSYPQQHHQWGSKKDKATNMRFKRVIRMFKAARNRLVEKMMITKDDAPSYFIECLLYNVPDALFKPKLALTYTGVLGWLKTSELGDFQCQNRKAALFGPGREQWSVKKARAFVRAMQVLWEAGG